MGRRAYFRIGGSLLVAALAALLAGWLSGPPTLLDGAKRVRDGMTPAEVERAMGRPPDQPSDGPNPAVWVSGNDTLEVEYRDGRVSKRNCYSTYHYHPSVWDRFLDWLGL